MSNESGNLAVISSRRVGSKSVPGSGSLHDLVLALQTTLDVDAMLGLFDRYLSPFVPHESFGFSNSHLGIQSISGKKGRHSCTYTLMLKEEYLGEWQMTRDRKFSETELECIEASLCRLLHPLHNALKYREALYFAYTDPLTGLANRSSLFTSMQRELEVARRYGIPLSVIFLDVDHFKAINDRCGHDVGDAVLQNVGRTVKTNVRTCDAVFRYGGEEFVILLTNTTQTGAMHLAERIRQSIEAADCVLGDISVQATASLGVAAFVPGESHVALLRRADQAMYAAKHGGRNRVEAARD